MSTTGETVGYTEAARPYMAARTAESEGAFFLPYIKQGDRLLDCGCGEGTITLGLARRAAPGEVRGMDADSSALERAGMAAATEGVENVTFEVGDVYRIEHEAESFDAVFAHMLLDHLPDKEKALAEMLRVLKPGGVVGVRSPDLGGSIWWPEAWSIARFKELFSMARDRLGGESNVGRRLPALLISAGFSGVDAYPSYEYHGNPEAAMRFAQAMRGFFEEDNHYTRTAIEAGWTDRDELNRIGVELVEWATEPGALSATPAVGVIGRKPDG